ncbi:acyltransferase family protein [Escherichia coli]|uniref:acyltransferase family protein n=2 Tax=Escherichia coli TaxID=562 RepID=UPI0032D9940B
MSNIKYRKDIDGLRAVAILPVLLFHVGYSGFSGGYVGVDIFFVISGYLITKILINDINNGTYSLLTFYERRIRRIIPALTCVILFVLIAYPLFLAPDNYSFLPKEIIGTLLFASNIVSFLKSGYFSTDAEQRPLLHTWSLGIEEQFYIISPIVLFLSFKYFKSRVGLILSLFAIVSFAFSVILTKNHPTASFYLIPTRYWELSFGALAAAGVFKKAKGRRQNEVLSILGLLLILFSIFTFTSKTVFPGYAALLPVLGATLIILNAEDTLVGKMLALKPLVFIGVISYSLYLWHWPLVVFSHDKYIIDLNLSREMLVVLSILIAWFSTRFIEAPFRNKQSYDRTRIFKYSSVAYSLLFLTSLAIWPLKGWTDRLSDEKAYILSSTKDYSPVRDKCHFSSGVPETTQYCILGVKDIEPSLFVWGDSHGAEISYALSKLTSVYTATYSACPPVVGFTSTERPECQAHNMRVLDFILNNKKIKNVVLAANYNKYEGDEKYSGFVKGFENTVKKLTDGGKRVTVLDQIPSPGVNVPNDLANAKFIVNKSFAYDDTTFKKIEFENGVNIFHFEKYLCDRDSCSMMYENYPVLFDDNHLSLTVAKIMAPHIYEMISDNRKENERF